MTFWNEIKPFLKFTPGERRGILALLIVMMLIISLKVIISAYRSTQHQNIEFEAIYSDSIQKDSINTAKHEYSIIDHSATRLIPVGPIDPNQASEEELKAIGLSKFAARNIIKYREKGGHFEHTDDLYKIYGIDTALFIKIEQFIRIAEPISQSAPTSQKVEINQTDSLQLSQNLGINPALSGRIIAYRSLLGGYYNKEQWLEIYGMEAKTLKILETNCTIDSMLIHKININRVNSKLLDAHPYISTYQAQAIIKYRKLSGNFKSAGELQKSQIFEPDELKKICVYFSFE